MFLPNLSPMAEFSPFCRQGRDHDGSGPHMPRERRFNYQEGRTLPLKTELKPLNRTGSASTDKARTGGFPCILSRYRGKAMLGCLAEFDSPDDCL